MGETEFIIALTGHRFLGHVFIPYLIEKNGPFYTVKRHVKPRDLQSEPEYAFNKWEAELVKTIDKYSDEKLMKKFSRAGNVSEFYATAGPAVIRKQVIPYLEKQMQQVISILMVSPVRLVNKDVKYANLYDEDVIEVSPLYARPVFYFEKTGTGTRYYLKVFHENHEVKLLNAQVRIITSDPCSMVYRGKLLAFEKLNAKKLLPFLEKDSVWVPQSLEEKYYQSFVLNIVRDFEVVADGFVIEASKQEKKAVLSIEKNLKLEPVFVLAFDYGNDRFLPGSKRQTAVSIHKAGNSFRFVKTVRDLSWETSVVEFLVSLGMVEKDGYFNVKGNELLLMEDALARIVVWVRVHRKMLHEKGISISQEKLEKKYFTGIQQLELKTGIRGDWFDIHAVVQFGEYRIPFVKLRKYILNGIREFELPNGEIAILPDEWFARFKGLLPFAKFHGDNIQFGKYHFHLLKNRLKGFDKDLIRQLQDLEKAGESVTLPANLNAHLRSYQEEGFRWMFHLYKNGFGGCLADDMGLGKTLQTLALLLKLKRKKTEIVIPKEFDNGGQLSLFGENQVEEEIQPASLIVVPTSLVHNWENEIRKFTPSLKTYKHTGLQRKNGIQIEKLSKYYDIILTTYGTVRNDIDFLKTTRFFYLILDESQQIKNPGSKAYKAIMELKSVHRLVLTGTPIENSLSDLWSQMNFLNPGILGNLAFFKREFITPVEKHANQEKQEKLQLIIRPFILRRKKSEVARDLPPYMEQVIYCEMTPEQGRIYEYEKSVIRNAILEVLEKDGMEKSSFLVLQGLTKLRQLANHPRLLDETPKEDSGKFREIFSMLENLVAENHKVLVFSSFVKHLELIEEQIKKENWKYAKLTGQTVKREQVIKEFQTDPENRIFLISLKAGGVGLNLTAADYVFIIDPWWNPAAENQAINRAHRIGQDKHVFVYRFITENSIEEKIQQLKERKSSLADKFINSNNPFRDITREEIVGLFS